MISSKAQNHSKGTPNWTNFDEIIQIRRIMTNWSLWYFTLHFVLAVDNEDKNITCWFFQILNIGAFLRPEIDSVHRYDGCCDNIFVSEHNSKFWESIWKNRQKTLNIQIINLQMLQFFSVKRLNYVSNGNWLSSFTQGNSQSPTDHSKLKCIKWELQRTVSDATK